MSYAPIYIKFALAYYTSGDPKAELGLQHFTSESGSQVYQWLKRENLIDENDRATDRLEAWVRHLCNQPLPEAKWVIPTPPNQAEGADT